MLAPMRRALGLFGLALAVPWVACDDRTVALSRPPTTSLSSSGGTSGSGDSTSFSATLDGSTSSIHGTASGGSLTFGPTGFTTWGPTSTTVSPFGAGGADDTDGATGHGDSDGSGGLPVGVAAVDGGGNEGGQGPECQDPDCLICASARANCDAPTLECHDTEGWLQKCSRCAACAVGSVCFQGFKCRPPCLDGGCGPGEYCDLESNACVRCLTDTDCAGFGAVCLAGECAECAFHSDCADPKRPYCIAGECHECLSHDDCEDGACVPGNRCLEVECRDHDDCHDESRPFCSYWICTECRGNADCDEDEYCVSYTCSPRN